MQTYFHPILSVFCYRPNLVNAAKTAMSSKILGPESSFFAEMAVDAVTAVRTESGGDVGKKVSSWKTIKIACDASGYKLALGTLPVPVGLFVGGRGRA